MMSRTRSGSNAVAVWVLHRAEQRLLPLEASRALTEAIPNGEFRVIPGPDLSPNCGDVDTLVGVIAEFLAGETIELDGLVRKALERQGGRW